MKRLFLSAGHSTTTDPGAIGINGLREADLTAELRKLLVVELQKLGVEVMVDNDENATPKTVRYIIEHLNNIDVALDLHFNASQHSGTGVEALYPFKRTSFEVNFANALCEVVSNTLGIYNRKGKTEANSQHGSLMFMRPNCENILLEVCFITNEIDVKSYLAKKNLLAINLADVIYNFLIN